MARRTVAGNAAKQVIVPQVAVSRVSKRLVVIKSQLASRLVVQMVNAVAIKLAVANAANLGNAPQVVV